MPEQTQLWRLVESWRRQQRFNVTQSALAKDIGVARGAISQWKYGETRPTPDNMRRLQSATGLRYRDLLDAMLQDMGYLPKEDASDGAPIVDEDEGTPTKPRGVHAESETRLVDPAQSTPRTIVLPDDQ